MKTYCKGLRITREVVEDAYAAWLDSPAGKRNWWRVEREHGSASALIDEIHTEIEERRLGLAPIVRSERWDDNARKFRVIGVASVKQQVCDYIAVTCVEPLLTARAGYYQVAGVKGKGAPLVKRALTRWAREYEGWYFVDCDVRKCYHSIDPELVMRIYERYVCSEDVLYVIGRLLASYDGGMEIGSYFSLRSVALVLSFAYHFVEGMCKERRGRRKRLVDCQIWHVDDFILISRDKRDLKSAVRRLEAYMRRDLGLELKPWKVARIGEDEPMTMSLFVVRPSHVELRPRTFLRGARAVRRYRRTGGVKRARRAVSYAGLMRQADTELYVRRNGVRKVAHDAAREISAAARKEGRKW